MHIRRARSREERRMTLDRRQIDCPGYEGVDRRSQERRTGRSDDVGEEKLLPLRKDDGRAPRLEH